MLQLTITTHKPEAIADLLEAFALAVTLQAHNAEEVFQIEPDDQPLWQETDVVALFNTQSDMTQAQLLLKSQAEFILAEKTEALAEKNWVEITQKQFEPMCFGESLWICPSWHDAGTLKGTVVKLDPGMAFGTGTHPTTAMCLTYLAQNPPTGKTVIDYGSGSGILSLAALALGAKEVIAVDHDEQALFATQQNARNNGFLLKAYLPADVPSISAPLVLANILANPLIELAPTLTKLCKNTLILSGLLTTEAERVFSAYQADFFLAQRASLNEWELLTLSNKA